MIRTVAYTSFMLSKTWRLIYSSKWTLSNMKSLLPRIQCSSNESGSAKRQRQLSRPKIGSVLCTGIYLPINWPAILTRFHRSTSSGTFGGSWCSNRSIKQDPTSSDFLKWIATTRLRTTWSQRAIVATLVWNRTAYLDQPSSGEPTNIYASIERWPNLTQSPVISSYTASSAPSTAVGTRTWSSPRLIWRQRKTTSRSDWNKS